jgi:hypothetical protein
MSGCPIFSPPGKGGIFVMALTKTMVVGIILIVFLAMGVSIASAAADVSAAADEQGKFVEARLAASDPVAGAEFGRSVAMDGGLVAVGAGVADAGTVKKAGAVYLFRRQGQKYIPEAKLTAPDATTAAEFGRVVAIQGNRVFVGARFAQVGTISDAGAVYVYRNQRGTWKLEQKISSPNAAAADNFGRALAVQGDLLVVTARKEDQALEDAGAAYVFVNKDGEWTYKAKLTAADPTSGAYFGQSVAVEGNLIGIGARNADPNGAGAVYVFRKAGNGWKQIAKVTPSDGLKDDHYGFSLAISGDVMTVGSRRADPSGAKDAGAAYVYSLKGDSVNLVTRLTASDAVTGDEFGQSVAMAGDVIAVGAWRDDTGSNANQGAVYLFRRAGGKWVQTSKITASDGKAGDEFGYSLAASGNRMVTGAHFADGKAGAAYVLPLKP